MQGSRQNLTDEGHTAKSFLCYVDVVHSYFRTGQQLLISSSNMTLVLGNAGKVPKQELKTGG